MTSFASEPSGPATGRREAPGATYVRVEVRGTSYCLDIGHVHGVVPAGPVTRVPGARSVIRGMIAVRGRVLPLGDLAVLFGGGRQPDEQGSLATVVLLGARHDDVPAFAVMGEVRDIVELGEPTLDPPPSVGLGAAAPLVTGVARLAGGGSGLVLDCDRLLASLSGTDPAP
jgi:purine-binding chemotaxis protein CheW